MEMSKVTYKKRAAKASLTRFETYINGIDVDQYEIEEMKVRIAKLEDAYKTFNLMQEEIASMDDATSVEELEAETEGIEEKYIRLKVLAEGLIRNRAKQDLNQINAERVVIEAPELINRNDRQQVPVHNGHIRLPRIELPSFTGEYEDWHAYYDMFNSLIHCNNELNDIQKFHYLKSSLKGTASEVVASLEISGNNYLDAWNRLKERYDNKRLIIQRHIKAIFELPIVKKEDGLAIRQVLDGAMKHTRALQALNRPTGQWDDLMVHIVTSKLDIRTIKEWENTVLQDHIPSFTDLIEFLKKRCQTLEAVSKIGSVNTSVSNSRQASHHKSNSCNAATVAVDCSYCHGAHGVYQCKEFKKLPVKERIKGVKAKGLCLNCLRGKHIAKDCSSGNCKICSKRHNSLLHIESNKSSTGAEIKESPKEEEGPGAAICNLSSSAIVKQSRQVLLSTAIVKIRHRKGHFVDVKALLDNGSQSNLVTESLVRKLELVAKDSQIEIRGINQQMSKAMKSVSLSITSRFESFATSLRCVVLPHITSDVPNKRISKEEMGIPKNIRLADPRFNIPSPVELLIGAERFWELLCVGQIKLGRDKPILQKTLLGWIIAGSISVRGGVGLCTSCHLSSTQNLDDMLQRFWLMEEVEDCSKKLIGNSYCEEHFRKTHSRNSEGRFIVKLPIKEEMMKTKGSSKAIVTKRLMSLERKLGNDPELRVEYSEFLKEYEQLGHMKVMEASALDNENRIFLPHQAVVKRSSETTKIRVVFDASSKDSKGISLNDMLHKGPVMQSDLVSIMMRFRCYRYVLSADVVKMYRQIRLHPDHQSLHTIAWRENTKETIKYFELMTLTYGTRPASFIAVRCMHQLAEDEGKTLPLAEVAVKRDFYMDDLLTGTDEKEELMELKGQIIELLGRGCFKLHKWNSNVPELKDDSGQSYVDLAGLEKEQESKLLGIRWNPKEDMLRFVTPERNKESRITKRTILAEISRLFDPLGLVGPVITLAKILMQSLWAWKIGWDDPVPANVHNSWLLIRNQLTALESINLPRLLIADSRAVQFHLHGFSDACEKAYGACIYVVCKGHETENSTALVCSKSRVAPLKILSLPRLELAGAILLVRLMDRVMAGLNIKICNRYYWVDSQIVLAWISGPAKKWHTFVANRVSEIQSRSSPRDWRYVKTKENPADLISRGVAPEQLKNSKLWWEGPIWLKTENEYPIYSNKNVINTVPEMRKEVIVALVQASEPWLSCERFSSLDKMMYAAAYALRFIYNTRCNKAKRRVGVSVTELTEAKNAVVKAVQAESWPGEIKRLNSNRGLARDSKLISLRPYMDENKLIRVGGRLAHASLTQEAKHPSILPASHHFTKLIIMDQHRKLFHGGVNATIAAIREEFWPVHIRREVKRVLRECVICRKANPRPVQHLMGQLPGARVNVARPFSRVGIDYCGPIFVRDRIRRNSKQYKAYVAIFVCMSTKAVHIELVEDMTTEAFLGALKRFVARRGLPSDIYSDNGRNFVGAERELQQLFGTPEFNKKVQEATAKEKISWHFIPARAPHFGGLWEAAVKTMKRHLKRTIGDASLTIAEMTTVLTQVEAVMNSRPLTPMTDDPNDMEALTPGHFLIGSSMRALPQRDVQDESVNRLSRWQHVEQLQQRFWSRWAKEYLNTCQQRAKWRSSDCVKIKVGQMVMMKEEEVMPWRWVLARITEVHPGTDGIVRVVTLRTAKGSYKRPIIKIAPILDE